MINSINKKPMIRICVLNWNGGIDLIECIESIKLNTSQDFLITVIDNNSTDNSLSSLSDNIEIIHLDENYGFGRGYNIGVEKCLTDEDEYIVLLNYDTIVPNNFIQSIIEKISISGPKYIYGAKILYNNKKDLIWYSGGEINLEKGIISHNNIRENSQSVCLEDQYTDYITGCCMIMHKDIFFKLEGFDERFFMYNEDVDFCLRAREMGVKSRFLSNVVLFHKVSSSFGGNYSIKKTFMKIKSSYQLFRKHYSILKSIFLLFIYILRSIFQIKSS